MLSIEDLVSARIALGQSVVRTRLFENNDLSKWVGKPLVLKLENEQIGGTFKRRGVLYRFMHLSTQQLNAGVLAVSGGNFGRAVAEISKHHGILAEIILPISAPSTSIAYIENQGAKTHLVKTVQEAFQLCKSLADSRGLTVLDDIGDTIIAAGYGTIGLELLEDCPDVSEIVVSVGGGTLLAGISSAYRQQHRNVSIYGAEPILAPSMFEAMRLGKPVDVAIETIISTLGVPRVSMEMLTHAQSGTSGIVLVSDEEAIEACRVIQDLTSFNVELAAGCALAGARKIAACPSTKGQGRMAVVICGGNTQSE